ncbi:DUF551 domain-containing protein [Serratia marcescens]|uniref:DUF551 domain-containing protein n=1 Tax=Serratia marcescens TaxID=615 RepID=UPI000DF95315|nr:DUF551 domain-containing protein [Serratia marcescens]SUI40394.1 Protein of uncharacterised function (DUF551) [Serratia marcescens]
MTRTLTTEQLRARAESLGLDFFIEKRAGIWVKEWNTGACVTANAQEVEMWLLLANREAQPVAWRYRYRRGPHKGTWIYVANESECATRPLHEKQALYTAPPAPAVPGIDELRQTFERAERESDDGFNLHKYGIGYADESTQARWESWLACRAAMLENIDKPAPQLDSVVTRHAEQPVSGGYKLPESWIACSEQTPVADGAYWCWFGKDKPSVIQQRVCIWNDRNHEWCDSAVTHWMPLPAAPEGGNDHDTRR